MAAYDQENTAMRLPDFSTFEPFNELRRKMNADEVSQTGQMSVRQLEALDVDVHNTDWFEADAAMPEIKLTPPPPKTKPEPVTEEVEEKVVLPEVQEVVVKAPLEETPPVVEEVPVQKPKRGKVVRKTRGAKTKRSRKAKHAPIFSWKHMPRDSLTFLTVSALSIGLLVVFFHVVAGRPAKKPVPFNAAASAPIERPAPEDPKMVPPALTQQQAPPKPIESRIQETQPTPQPATRVPSHNTQDALAGYESNAAARGGRNGGNASSGAASPGRGNGGANGAGYGGIGAVGGVGKVTNTGNAATVTGTADANNSKAGPGTYRVYRRIFRRHSTNRKKEN